MGSHRVGHDSSDLAAAATAVENQKAMFFFLFFFFLSLVHSQASSSCKLQTLTEINLH